MKTLIALTLLTLSSQSFADGLARADFGYVMDSTTSGGTETKNTRQIIELGGAYIWPEGWNLGGAYAMEKYTHGNPAIEGNRTSYGPSFGWISRSEIGMYINAIYDDSSKYVESGANYEGSGYQADLGLKANVSRFFLVAGLSYSAFEYTKNNGNTLSPSVKHSHITPRIGLLFQF